MGGCEMRDWLMMDGWMGGWVDRRMLEESQHLFISSYINLISFLNLLISSTMFSDTCHVATGSRSKNLIYGEERW